MPKMRWPTSVVRLCSMRSGYRLSWKQAANRSTSLMARSVAPSSSAPASEVIAPPSKDATTARPSTGAKSSCSKIHCVGIGEVLCAEPRCGCTTTLAHAVPQCRTVRPAVRDLDEQTRLQASIAGLEAKRGVLDDATLDTAIATLRQRLADIDQPSPLPTAHPPKGERKDRKS